MDYTVLTNSPYVLNKIDYTRSLIEINSALAEERRIFTPCIFRDLDLPCVNKFHMKGFAQLDLKGKI